MQLDLEQVVTIDFETYFDKEYSLRSKTMNTSEYIRDKQFLAHCVSIKIGSAPAKVYWYEDVAPALHAVRWGELHLLAHNTAFDGLILAEHYQTVPPASVPRYYLDTVSMARALHGNSTRASLEALCAFYGIPGKNPNILGKMKGLREIPMEIREEAALYCAGDTDKCYQIFCQMIPIYPGDEIRLIDWTIRQFCDPVLYVDIPRATAELEREQIKKAELIAKTGLVEEDLQSANKFAAQLRALNVEPPMKLSARTKLLTFAFSQQDDEFMQLVTHENSAVRELVAARLAAKSTIGETRAQRFVNVGDRPLPVGLNYAAAHTLRWGGTNKMNLQNLEKEERDEQNLPIPNTGELRKSILAPPGHQIVVADSGQIEARVTAYVAQQLDLLELFASGGDPYTALASEIYREPVTKADRDRRAVGKAGVLGLGFYMGAPRFQGTLALGTLGPKMTVSLDFAKDVVETYRRENDKIKTLWKSMDHLLLKMLMKARSDNPHAESTHSFAGLDVGFDCESIWLPNNMGLHYPDLKAEWDERFMRFYDYSYRSNKEYVRVHAGVLTENLIQALARCTVGEQLLRVSERYRVVMMTHDELVAIASDDEADTCLAFMLEQMAIPPAWMPGLPLKAEGGYDRCYSK